MSYCIWKSEAYSKKSTNICFLFFLLTLPFSLWHDARYNQPRTEFSSVLINQHSWMLAICKMVSGQRGFREGGLVTLVNRGFPGDLQLLKGEFHSMTALLRPHLEVGGIRICLLHLVLAELFASHWSFPRGEGADRRCWHAETLTPLWPSSLFYLQPDLLELLFPPRSLLKRINLHDGVMQGARCLWINVLSGTHHCLSVPSLLIPLMMLTLAIPNFDYQPYIISIW